MHHSKVLEIFFKSKVGEGLALVFSVIKKSTESVEFDNGLREREEVIEKAGLMENDLKNLGERLGGGQGVPFC